MGLNCPMNHPRSLKPVKYCNLAEDPLGPPTTLPPGLAGPVSNRQGPIYRCFRMNLGAGKQGHRQPRRRHQQLEFSAA